jgi:peptidoglycan hydrolase-like protein with peptidoglycan-binding domain
MANPVLKSGSKGEAVTGLQSQLYRLGYDPGAQDGVFGRRTESAVKQFQRDKGLAADGIVGPQTWAALEAAIAEYVE